LKRFKLFVEQRKDKTRSKAEVLLRSGCTCLAQLAWKLIAGSGRHKGQHRLKNEDIRKEFKIGLITYREELKLHIERLRHSSSG
jgi:hypothetical protein